VLDYGCGAGRHLKHLRAARADIRCVGIEVCGGLRAHCGETVAAPATFVPTWQQARNDGPFDLILLMGNGLGVLGDEDSARAGLGELVGSLAPGGRLVIETGSGHGRGYRTDTLEIRFRDQVDGPFTWGAADRDWVVDTLAALGCEVQISPSRAPGGFFFAVARRPSRTVWNHEDHPFGAKVAGRDSSQTQNRAALGARETIRSDTSINDGYAKHDFAMSNEDLNHQRDKLELKDMFTGPRNLHFGRPRILWYPSGEVDFFPLIGYSRGFRADLTDEIKSITEPDLFIYTCLSPNLAEEIIELFFRSGVLFEDEKTVIRSVDPEYWNLNRENFHYRIDPRYINHDPFKIDPHRRFGWDTVYSKIQLIDKKTGYTEEVDLLYVLAENINFFEQVVKPGLVEVLHLCTIREGLGFGGGRRSVIDHIYCQVPDD